MNAVSAMLPQACPVHPSTSKPHTGLHRLLLVLLTAVLCTSCSDFAYVLPAAAGQWNLVASSVPIEQALDEGNLTPEQVAKLELIVDVRQFASQRIGLNTAGTYELFYDGGGEPIAFNLSACKQDAFEPYLWTFPFFGSIPYLGFFDFGAAEARREALEGQGYDVFIYEIDAYNLGSFAPNPVLSSMLKRSEFDIAETVVHELLHNTVWRPGDTVFNESLATFVGRMGALDYYHERFADDPDTVTAAVHYFEDQDRLIAFLDELLAAMDELFATEVSAEEKIAAREGVLKPQLAHFAADIQPLMNTPEDFEWVNQIPVNNAYLLAFRRYNTDLSIFEAVFQSTGGNWPVTLAAFRAAAGAESDPYEYLMSWAADPAARSGVADIHSTPAVRGPCPLALKKTLLQLD